MLRHRAQRAEGLRDAHAPHATEIEVAERCSQPAFAVNDVCAAELPLLADRRLYARLAAAARAAGTTRVRREEGTARDACGAALRDTKSPPMHMRPVWITTISTAADERRAAVATIERGAASTVPMPMGEHAASDVRVGPTRIAPGRPRWRRAADAAPIIARASLRRDLARRRRVARMSSTARRRRRRKSARPRARLAGTNSVRRPARRRRRLLQFGGEAGPLTRRTTARSACR